MYPPFAMSAKLSAVIILYAPLQGEFCSGFGSTVSIRFSSGKPCSHTCEVENLLKVQGCFEAKTIYTPSVSLFLFLHSLPLSLPFSISPSRPLTSAYRRQCDGLPGKYITIHNLSSSVHYYKHQRQRLSWAVSCCYLCCPSFYRLRHLY